MPIDTSIIDDLKAKNSEVFQLSHGDAEVLVKGPTRPAWKRFRALAADEKRRSDALEQLLRDCLLYPSLEGLDAMLEKKPGLAETFGSRLVDIAGLSDEVEKKVL